MKCPSCQHPNTQVLETRTYRDGGALKRKRKCESATCGYRFTTFEMPDVQFPLILKRDNRRETYDPEKLKKSIIIATRKRPVSSEQIEQILEQIEQKLLSSLEKEINARQLGEWIMAALLQIDQVAYIRFASVYQNIQSLDEFASLIQRLSVSEGK